MNTSKKLYLVPAAELSIITFGGVVAASWASAEGGGTILGKDDINNMGDF